MVSVCELSRYECASNRRPNRKLFGVKHLSKSVGSLYVIGLLFSTRSISSKIVNSSSVVNLASPSCIFNCDFTNPINHTTRLSSNSNANQPQTFPQNFTFPLLQNLTHDLTISSGKPLLEMNLQKLFIIALLLDLSQHPEQLLCSQHTYTTPPTSYTFSHTYQNTYFS